MGIGKSALASKLVQKLSSFVPYEFECIFWKTIIYPCSVDELLDELLDLINGRPVFLKKSIQTQEKINTLLNIFKKRRYLLILDNANLLFEDNRYTKRVKRVN